MKMKAMIVQKPGPAESFQLVDIERPSLRSGHLLVEVKATSVNPIDMKVRSRELPFSPVFPAILHGDFAGIVSEVGEGVTKFKPGDRVYGCGGGVKGTTGGALGEYMLVDADLTSPMPANLKFEEAAALPLVSITAWEALFDKMKVKSGDTLLVHGGVGGVGHIAAQLGNAFGAVVHTTVSSDEDAILSRRFGSHHPINYRTQTATEYREQYTNGRGFDWIFDTVGGANLQNSFEAAKLNGVIACIATGGTHELSKMYVKGISLLSVLMLIPLMTGEGRAHYGQILFEVKKLVEAGKVRPYLHAEVFDWKDISKGHALLESGKYQGKIVVRVGR